MIPLGLTRQELNLYHERLFSSHSFRIAVDVLTTEERPVGSARILDGSIKIGGDDGIRRTASLQVSDPDGALDFAGASEWSPGTIWADRLIRVRHILEVPTLGEVAAPCFVGPPSSMSRSGAEVAVECQDKAALADRGSEPFTVPQGLAAVDAIRRILAQCTGERRFRFPATRRRLSRSYSVGWSDESSPWVVAQRIARRELNMQLLYSADGYALLRRRPSSPCGIVPRVTGEPSSSVDFTGLTNRVEVLGKTTTKTKGNVKVSKQVAATANIKAGHSLSAWTLGRHAVPRWWPVLIEDNEIGSKKRARRVAAAELRGSDRLEDSGAFACIPFFHGDADDIIVMRTASHTQRVRLNDVTIPLGVGDDMAIGEHRWASAAPPRRVKGRILKNRRRTDKKKGSSGGRRLP